MSTEEARQAKTKLERHIRDCLEAFQQQYSIKVEEVSIVKVRATVEDRVDRIVEVEIKVSL